MKTEAKAPITGGNYSNTKFDELLKRASTELNADKHTAILKKTAQIEYDQALFVPLHWQNLA